MKVLDIITESPAGGDPLDMLTVTGIINAASGTQVQVRRIQELLSQHKRQGTPLWQGPIDGNHTTELDTAIMEWKRWVNEQLGETLTDTSRPGLTQREVRYLRAPLTANGRIDRVALRGSSDSRGQRGNPFEGQRFQNGIHETNPQFTQDRTENMRLFISSIGISGWLAILNEGIETLEDASPQTKLRQVRDKMAEINASLDSPPRWLNNLARVLEVAKYGNKNVNGQTLVAPTGLANGETAPQRLFEYYARLATFILDRDAGIDQQARDNVQDRIDQTGSQLSEVRISSIVQDLIRAFRFGFFTGATDETTIEEIFLGLRIAGDYDAIAEAYERSEGEQLNRRLARELNDEDYTEIVGNNLLRIQRIMPLPLYRAIRFGENEQIDVTINQTEFFVKKQRGDGGVIDWGLSDGSGNITGNTASVERDVIIEDMVLRAAVEASDGTLPENVTVTQGDANFRTARSVFENELQENIPEMVAFYTGSEPFEFGAQVGNFRARGILEQLAILSAGGGTIEDLRTVANEEIMEDRTKLREELNVWFDPQYADEVSSELTGFRSMDDVDDVDDENIEVLEEHQLLAQRFAGEDNEDIDEATREILTSDNPADTWEKVSIAARDMGLTDRQHEPIDLIHDREADSLTALIQGNELDNPIYRLMTGNIPIYLFPNQVAIILDKAFNDRAFLGLFPATDEQPIAIILDLIQDRDQYQVISRAYSRQNGGRDLANELRTEDSELYAQYWDKFGLDQPLQISTVETPYGAYSFEQPNAEGRIQFTLTRDTDPPLTFIRPGFGEIENPDDTERNAWLGWEASRWMMFRTPSGGNPIRNGAPQNIVDELEQFLERLGLDNEGNPRRAE